MPAENLLNTTQNFLTPDFIKKFSDALNQPTEKVQSGLRTVIPTFLMGLVNKGSSKEGAEAIVNLATKDGIDSTSGPDDLNDTHYLVKGDDALRGIFGKDLSTVTSSIGTSTGLGTSSVAKMMGMMAPILMGVLGRKIKNENLNATGMMDFLSQQKKVLAGFIPQGISGMFSGNAKTNPTTVSNNIKETFKRPVTSYATTDGVTPHYTSKGAPWLLLALLAIVVMGFIWWWSGLSNKIVQNPGREASMVQNIERAISTTAVTPVASSLNELNTFLSSGNEAELPKRFNFQNLNFATGTASLNEGYQSELNQISTALKEYPSATARIIGYTDNTGNPTSNQSLSEARANSVKEQLVNSGISADRIEIEGRGQEAPVASNNSEEGRAMNRRIEFVITSFN